MSKAGSPTLESVLIAAFPSHCKEGKLKPGKLAKALGFSRNAPYLWVRTNKISMPSAKAVVLYAETEITLDQLVPFVV